MIGLNRLRGPRRRTRLVVALMLTCGCLLAACTTNYDNMFPAGIYNCYDQPSPCQADNSLHTVYLGHLGPGMGKAALSTLANDFDAHTRLTVDYLNYENSQTDVVYNYADLPGDIVGSMSCLDVQDSLQCGAFHVDFDTTRLCQDNCDDQHAQSLACHETGHTVGLLHGDNAEPPVDPQYEPTLGCKRTYYDLSDPFLGTHNTGEINATY